MTDALLTPPAPADADSMAAVQVASLEAAFRLPSVEPARVDTGHVRESFTAGDVVVIALFSALLLGIVALLVSSVVA